MNAVYYDGTKAQLGKTPATLPINHISHIYYIGAIPTSTGSVTFHSNSDIHLDSPVDGYQGALKATAALKAVKPELKVLLSVGHGSEKEFGAIVQNADRQSAFCNAVRNIIERYELDGVDVCWLHPSTRTETLGICWLLSQLRMMLPPEHYIITMAWGPNSGFVGDNAVLTRAQSFVDFVNLRCFDISGPWRAFTGHHSNLYDYPGNESREGPASCCDLINSVLCVGVPKPKVVFGVPLYGWCYAGANFINQPYEKPGGKDGSGMILYHEIPPRGYEERLDFRLPDICGAAYCASEDGGFITYDNPDTISLKAEVIQLNALAGFFFTEATGDTNDYRSLISAGYLCLRPD